MLHVPAFYRAYVDHLPPGDILQHLRSQRAALTAVLNRLSDPQSLHRYAHDKWSIKEVLGHINDSERIFAYRALRFARGDAVELPGFEQDDYVLTARSNEVPWQHLIAEFVAVRSATIALFEGIPAEGWSRQGVANGATVSVDGLAAIIYGHAQHHLNIITERYIPSLT